MGETISVNRQARHEYFVLETYEAGIELYGTEIKIYPHRFCEFKRGLGGHSKRPGVYLRYAHKPL